MLSLHTVAELKLLTMPALIGSPTLVKMIGIAVVAA